MTFTCKNKNKTKQKHDTWKNLIIIEKIVTFVVTVFSQFPRKKVNLIPFLLVKKSFEDAPSTHSHNNIESVSRMFQSGGLGLHALILSQIARKVAWTWASIHLTIFYRCLFCTRGWGVLEPVPAVLGQRQLTWRICLWTVGGGQSTRREPTARTVVSNMSAESP